MKLPLKFLSCFLILFLMQSCSQLKPSEFDYDTWRYNNFKQNYSIEIKYGYSLLYTQEEKRIIRNLNLPIDTGPKNSAMFTNEANNASFSMYVIEELQQPQHKKIKKDTFFEFNLNLTTEKIKGLVKTILFKPSATSLYPDAFVLMGTSTSENYETNKADFLAMIDSIRAPAFTDEERKVNRVIFRTEPLKILTKQGTYVRYNNGVIYDTKTHLEWYVCHDEDISWNKASKWVSALSVDSGNWRLPTISELKSLYIYRLGGKNINPLFKMSGWSVLSSENKNILSENNEILKFGYFDFLLGKEKWTTKSGFGPEEIIAVRNKQSEKHDPIK